MTRPAQLLRDSLSLIRAGDPNDPRIPEYEAELAEANAIARERRAAREAVKRGLLTATHVRLRDGWVEVVRVDAPAHEVIVANGEHREERIGLQRVLEVRSL